ncbi:MAG: FKBP-type peptidyl-prolyl cis-trans isomerase [Candidatus Hydrogenedentes bacterium]|nr:FKBP-type peptidyl-prolyl cis-trans isomerase [Candidatus Hydrogenedentota bacterium]
MKHLIWAFALVAALLAAPVVLAQENAPAPFASDQERISYCLGAQIGLQLTKSAYELDAAALVQGLQDAAAGNALRANPQEIQQAAMDFQMKTREAAEAKGKALEEQAAELLKANATAEGVKVTASGLQYKVITEGTGATPAVTDRVRVHYRGTLVNGEEFDSSYSRGEPAEFTVNGVIPGWTEALQLMKAGAKYQLVIPSDLAYGPRGTGNIPPNATLIFEVELLEVLQ